MSKVELEFILPLYLGRGRAPYKNCIVDKSSNKCEVNIVGSRIQTCIATDIHIQYYISLNLLHFSYSAFNTVIFAWRTANAPSPQHLCQAVTGDAPSPQHQHAVTGSSVVWMCGVVHALNKCQRSIYHRITKWLNKTRVHVN